MRSVDAALDADAQRAGVDAPWSARVDRLAGAVLDALEAQPKSLSQANAEELLTRQVYTNPGHFLIELLQNADDAGATVWGVRVERDRVEIHHDGVPFDARHVVGILSISQTTRSNEQIGCFGVGFKSVYNICEPPQIYSGGPERLAALPGEVLLTFNSLQQIDVQFGSRKHRVTVSVGGAGRVQLQEQDRSRHFLVEQADLLYPGHRDANRAATTPLLVAIALDKTGNPRSLGERPTVYSYLPTGQRSGC